MFAKKLFKLAVVFFSFTTIIASPIERAMMLIRQIFLPKYFVCLWLKVSLDLHCKLEGGRLGPRKFLSKPLKISAYGHFCCQTDIIKDRARFNLTVC